MAVSDFLSHEQSGRQRVVISTVDTSNRTVNAELSDGTPVSIVVWEADPIFRWPREGEQWTIYRESGSWKLDKIVQSDSKIDDVAPGSMVVDVPTGEIILETDDGDFAIKSENFSIERSGSSLSIEDSANNLSFTLAANAITMVSGSQTISMSGGVLTANGRSFAGTDSGTFIGNGVTTTFIVPHNLGTALYIPRILTTVDGILSNLTFNIVPTTTQTTVNVTNGAPTNGVSYTLLVIG